MSGEFIAAVAGIVTVLQLCKRTLLGGVETFDEFARRRPLKRFHELIDAASPESRLRPVLELERESELFRQIFGKTGSRNIEQEILDLRSSGEFSTRELRHLLRFTPYDAAHVGSQKARDLALWNQRAAIVQALLVGVEAVIGALGMASAHTAAAFQFFLAVLGVALVGIFYFVREAIHAHLACCAIDRVREIPEARLTAESAGLPCALSRDGA